MNAVRERREVRRPAADWARSAWGVDLDGGRVYSAHAVRFLRRVSCVEEREAGASFAAHGRGGEIVCGGVQQRESFTRWVTVAIGGIRRAARVLPTALDVQLPFPLEDCAYRFVAHESDGASTGALVGLVRASELQAALARYGASGVDPEVMDQEALALWTQSHDEYPLTRVPGTVQRVTVVYLGTDRITVVTGEDGRFHGAFSSRSWNPDGLRRFFSAQFPGGPGPMEWRWAGPMAADPAVLDPILREALERWPGRSRPHANPRTLLARALAVRALKHGALRCNLREGRFAHARFLAHDRRTMRRALAAWLAAGLAMALTGVGLRVYSQAAENRMDRAIHDQAVRLAPGVRVQKGFEVEAVQREMARRHAEVAPLLEWQMANIPGRLAALMAAAREQGVTLAVLGLDGSAPRLEGTAPDAAAADRFVRSVGALGWPMKVQSTEALAEGGRVRFLAGRTGP